MEVLDDVLEVCQVAYGLLFLYRVELADFLIKELAVCRQIQVVEPTSNNH